MDRAMLFKHVEQANRHIAKGEAIAERQRRLIETLEREGQNTTDMRIILEKFESLVTIYRQDRDWLERWLSTRSSN